MRIKVNFDEEKELQEYIDHEQKVIDGCEDEETLILLKNRKNYYERLLNDIKHQKQNS